MKAWCLMQHIGSDAKWDHIILSGRQASSKLRVKAAAATANPVFQLECSDVCLPLFAAVDTVCSFVI